MTPVDGLGRIVVTGAGGFVGRRLLGWLERAGANVRGWRRADVDLLDSDAVAAAMRRDAPDTIFHLAAAGVSRELAFEVDVIRQDVTMVEHLLRQARPGMRFVYSGTMSEYGYPGELAEGTPCTPHTVYGIAKLAGGLHALAAGRRRGLVVSNVRLFGVDGPGESKGRLVSTLTRALRGRWRVALSDGLPRRDFIHVDDACAAMVANAARDPEPDVVDVGPGRAVRVRDEAEWIAAAARAPADLLGFGEGPRAPYDEDLLQPNVDRVGEVIGWVPTQRLVPGLSRSLFEEGGPDAIG